MATATWDSIFAGRPDLIRKALFGSVLAVDYSPTRSFAGFSPLDPDTGLIKSTLLADTGMTDLGYLDENGAEFTPSFTTSATNGWQNRMALRTDVTGDDEEAKFVCIQKSPIVEALYNNQRIASMPALGAPGYSAVKTGIPSLIHRSLLFLALDGGGPYLQYMWKLYPKCLMTKPDKQDWQAKTELQYSMTFTPYPDPVSGYAIKWGHDGPGWRALGATTGATGTGATAGT